MGVKEENNIGLTITRTISRHHPYPSLTEKGDLSLDDKEVDELFCLVRR